MFQNVLIIGMGKSGLSSARLCRRQGKKVTLYDGKERQSFSESVLSIEEEGVELSFGAFNPELYVNHDLMVLSPGVPTSLPFIEAARNKMPVIGEIELAYLFAKGSVVGITGTNGKTTTTTLMGEIVGAFFDETFVVGNIGIPYTDLADQMTDNAMVIAELSSYQLESIETFRPYISCVLNLTEDHLQRHKTMDGYCDAKLRVTQNQKSSDYMVLNKLDPYCIKMAERTNATVIWFSTGSEGHVYVEDQVIYSVIGGQKRGVLNVSDIPLLGAHNVENICAAVAMSTLLGVPDSVIKDRIKGFKGVAHRNEFVAEIGGVKYYNDSKATNPDAAISAVISMDRPTVLIAGGMDKGSDYTQWISHFSGIIKKVVLFGETKEDIKEACIKQDFNDITIIDTLKEAVEVASKLAQPGQNVLLSPACASWDMFDNFEVRGDLFKKYVLELER